MSDPIAMATLFFGVTTAPLSGSNVTSETSLFIPHWDGLDTAPNDVVCFVGKAEGLEEDIASFYEGGGEQCQAANGCGVHVHAGTDCTSVETQSEYDDDIVASESCSAIDLTLIHSFATRSGPLVQR